MHLGHFPWQQKESSRGEEREGRQGRVEETERGRDAIRMRRIGDSSRLQGADTSAYWK